MSGTITMDRRGLDVLATGVERTLVDCIERPDLTGGVEELASALQSAKAFDVDKFAKLALVRENRTLVGVCGAWLESRRDDLFVDAHILDELKRAAPPVPRPALGSDAQGPNTEGWNVILPADFVNPSFEGMSPEMMRERAARADVGAALAISRQGAGCAARGRRRASGGAGTRAVDGPLRSSFVENRHLAVGPRLRTAPLSGGR
ncbi:hypothetical protein [Rhodopseudomonas sp.]|uniref:hypothetical protein n=1 Tax=Rhodopseudomonas sp. TaxID=1078 RepID=UPI0039E2450A